MNDKHTNECIRISRMYGFDVTFHHRPDGNVDTLSGFLGKTVIAHMYQTESAAVSHTLAMLSEYVERAIITIEMEKAEAELRKNTTWG